MTSAPRPLQAPTASTHFEARRPGGTALGAVEVQGLRGTAREGHRRRDLAREDIQRSAEERDPAGRAPRTFVGVARGELEREEPLLPTASEPIHARNLSPAPGRGAGLAVAPMASEESSARARTTSTRNPTGRIERQSVSLEPIRDWQPSEITLPAGGAEVRPPGRSEDEKSGSRFGRGI